jgi:hypothetical protein
MFCFCHAFFNLLPLLSSCVCSYMVRCLLCVNLTNI